MLSTHRGAVPVQLLACGDAALLAQTRGLRDVLDLLAALREQPPPGLVDLVPAARTVLVRVGPGVDPGRVDAHVRDVAARAGGAAQDPAAEDGPEEGVAEAPGVDDVVELPVVYDGPDLAEAAAALGTDPAGLVAQHTARTWTVAFVGFAPGFGYCVRDAAGPGEGVGAAEGESRTDDGRAWDVPRRASPRTSVPAGSVALAGPFTGVYPATSPGGWQLVGRTDAVLWDVDRDPPALLPPGARVRFVEVGP